VRDALPIDEWPEERRLAALERLARDDDPELRRLYEQREPLLELLSPDDPSDAMTISAPPPEAPELHRHFLSAGIWWLFDRGPPEAKQTFAHGVASLDVHAVRWEAEDGGTYSCSTIPVPGVESYRAFIMPVGPCDRGTFTALGAEEKIICENYYGGTFIGDQEPPEEIQRYRGLPQIGEGPLPGGGRWVLSAGMVDSHLYHFLKHEPRGGGGGAGGPVMGQDQVIKLDSVGGRVGCIQLAVGQLAKRTSAVEAFDEEGIARHAERIVAAHLTVDYFLAWTEGPALERIVALDGAGERLVEVEVPRVRDLDL